jgi:WD40 repeat protein
LLPEKKLIFSVKTNNSVLFISDLNNGAGWISVDKNGDIRTWDSSGVSTGTIQSNTRPKQITIDAGKRYLAIYDNREQIIIYDLQSMMPLNTITAKNKIVDVLFIGFDRLGQQLLAISNKGKVISWSPQKQTIIREMSLGGNELYGSQNVVHAVSTNRASNIFVISLQEVALASGGRGLMRDNKIIAFDWQTGMEIKRMKPGWRVDQISLGPGNDHVAVLNDDTKNFFIINLRKGEIVQTINLQEQPKFISISENNQWIAAGFEQGKTMVWKLSFQESDGVLSGQLPSLSGRIRATSGTEPALTKGQSVKIAILRFDSKDIDQTISSVCLNTLSNTLTNLKYITLIERSQIDKVIMEQDFSMTDFSEQSNIQVGRLLSADYLIFGNIGKLGSVYVFSARIVNVSTGKVMQGREVVCEECRDQDFYDAIKTLASCIAQ